MNLEVHGAFVYFTIPILGGIPITQTTVSSFLVMLALIVISLVVHKKLKKRPDGWQVLVEKGVSMLYNMVRETMGEHNLHWAPFIGTIFVSSLLGSFIGLTGFLRSSTADLSCVMVWALMVTAIIWYNSKVDRKLGSLMLMYWGASLMWLVDAVAEYIEVGAEFFTPAASDMLNDAFLGISVVALGMFIWLVILLIKDPSGKVKAMLAGAAK